MFYLPVCGSYTGDAKGFIDFLVTVNTLLLLSIFYYLVRQRFKHFFITYFSRMLSKMFNVLNKWIFFLLFTALLRISAA